MASISSKETKPEILVRSFLFKHGFRFRKNVKSLPGKPDIVLAKYHSAIFVHGCFWHGHSCKAAKLPSTNIKFWKRKICDNRTRDAKILRELKKNWKVIVVWQCQLKNQIKREARLIKLIRQIEGASLSTKKSPLKREL